LTSPVTTVGLAALVTVETSELSLVLRVVTE